MSLAEARGVASGFLHFGTQKKAKTMRYFFHIIDHGHLVPDEEGMECLSVEAACAEARASATDLARQAIRHGALPSDICVEIQDSDGRVVSALTVEEVMTHPQTPAFATACDQPDAIRH